MHLAATSNGPTASTWASADEACRARTIEGLAYWSDGRGAERIILITPGYQMVALDARSGKPIPEFGKNGIVDLWKGLGRQVQPNEIGSCSPAMIVGDIAVVGNALLSGSVPRTMNNVPGYIRGYVELVLESRAAC